MRPHNINQGVSSLLRKAINVWTAFRVFASVEHPFNSMAAPKAGFMLQSPPLSAQPPTGKDVVDWHCWANMLFLSRGVFLDRAWPQLQHRNTLMCQNQNLLTSVERLRALWGYGPANCSCSGDRFKCRTAIC